MATLPVPEPQIIARFGPRIDLAQRFCALARRVRKRIDSLLHVFIANLDVLELCNLFDQQRSLDLTRRARLEIFPDFFHRRWRLGVALRGDLILVAFQ